MYSNAHLLNCRGLVLFPIALQQVITPQLGLLMRCRVETMSGEKFVLFLDSSIRKLLGSELNFLLVFSAKGTVIGKTRR